MPSDTIVNSENEIKDIIIDEEIVDIIEHCKTKDLNNPVEILKHFLTMLVQGRPLEIEDVTKCISGTKNFFFLSRFSFTIIHKSQDCRVRGRAIL